MVAPIHGYNDLAGDLEDATKFVNDLFKVKK
jgi:hypothetical protein